MFGMTQIIFLTLLLSFGACYAQELQPVKDLILPGESFLIQNHPAFILLPDESKRIDPQPWVFYGPTLPGYPDKHEKWMHEQFLDAGVAVAGIDVGEAYGSPTAIALFTALYDELTANRRFSKRPCMLGRSRGGLHVTSWACDNPEKVSGIAGIYPVFDFRTYPGLEATAEAFQLSKEVLLKDISRYNPIERLDSLIAARTPVHLIHGALDTVVPLAENSQRFANTYQAKGVGALVTLEVIKDQGHNFWEGFFRSPKLIDFVITRAKSSL